MDLLCSTEFYMQYWKERPWPYESGQPSNTASISVNSWQSCAGSVTGSSTTLCVSRLPLLDPQLGRIDAQQWQVRMNCNVLTSIIWFRMGLARKRHLYTPSLPLCACCFRGIRVEAEHKIRKYLIFSRG
jgi:hypothetical protein